METNVNYIHYGSLPLSLRFLAGCEQQNDTVYTRDMYNAKLLRYVMICTSRPVRTNSKGVSRRRGFFRTVWLVKYLPNWRSEPISVEPC
jgi:hypothetical protein